MGTRADFYVGRGEKAEWLGSIAWDGYRDGLPDELFAVSTEEEWRAHVGVFLEAREDATFPKDGWPWPWPDSNTTDRAYSFVDGKAQELKTDGSEKFPNMEKIQNVTLGGRSGLMVFGVKKPSS